MRRRAFSLRRMYNIKQIFQKLVNILIFPRVASLVISQDVDCTSSTASSFAVNIELAGGTEE